MTEDTTTVARLAGAQAEIVTAYRAADHGLFILDCGPGVGKSFTLTDLAAKLCLRRWADGDRTPARGLCVLAFARDDAVSLTSDICARLDTLVEHDLTPGATAVAREELPALKRRLRQTPYIQTVDGLLRHLLADIVADPTYERFDELPAIGHEVRLERIHRACADESLATHPTVAARLVDASPEESNGDDVGTLLRAAHEHCQRHQLSVAAFHDRLTASIDAVYGEDAGTTDPAAALKQTLTRCLPGVSSEDVTALLAGVDVPAVVDGDRTLRAAWLTHVAEFCTVLETYTEAYEQRTRATGVLSHTDCARLVAAYFRSDRAFAHRQRIRRRYRGIDHWLLDEAQDIAAVQHDALAPLVGDDDRVLAAGDPRQSIYEFRGAVPELFGDAVETGVFLGVDWDHHVTVSASTTYRARPAIVAALNTIATAALADPTRGSCNGDLDPPTLETAREATDEPSVHVAPGPAAASPRGPGYAADEAALLATYVASGLADGTLTPPESDATATTTDPPVTVVCRRTRHLETFVAAFEAEGLTVTTADTRVFDTAVARAVLDVARWLTTPDDPAALRALLQPHSRPSPDVDAALDPDGESPLGVARDTPLWQHLAAADWRLADCPSAAVAVDGPALSARGQRVVDALDTLRARHGSAHPAAGAVGELVADIVATLDLRADANGLLSAASGHTGHERVAVLDALADWLAELDLDGDVTPQTVLALLTPFEAETWRGPTATTAATDADVQFATIHAMKGDEASTVVLADPGLVPWRAGTVTERLVTTPDVAALAPPDIDRPTCGPLGCFEHGLFTPPREASANATGHVRDVGLRWLTERWGTDDTGQPTLIGHDHLQTVVRRQRASYWRHLYVALSRAREHLVVALPPTVPDAKAPRDRWLETIRSALAFEGQSDTYRLAPPDTAEPFQVGVNDVSVRSAERRDAEADQASLPHAATSPLDPTALAPFTPRQIAPSALGPLSDDLERWGLAYLRDEQLHSTASPVEPSLPFDTSAIDSEKLGRVLHEFLATLVRQVRGAYRDTWSGTTALARTVIRDRYSDASQSLRAALVAFVTDTLVPQIADATFWHQLRAASAVYIEQTLRGHRRCGGRRFEIGGTADVVVELASGEWVVFEVKMSFGDLTADARARYAMQTETYRALLAAQLDAPVSARLETFGVTRATIVPSLPEDAIRRRLSTLQSEG